jgi:ketosteroid isomerase-like protein
MLWWLTAITKATALDAALENLLTYFAALTRGDVDGAADCFTNDVVYHHPSFQNLAGHGTDDGARHQAVGRPALKNLLQLRGDQHGVRHIVTAFARSGDLCFSEGYAEMDGEPFLSGVSVFRVDETGKIAEYQPYTHAPALPALGTDAHGLVG